MPIIRKTTMMILKKSHSQLKMSIHLNKEIQNLNSLKIYRMNTMLRKYYSLIYLFKALLKEIAIFVKLRSLPMWKQRQINTSTFWP